MSAGVRPSWLFPVRPHGRLGIPGRGRRAGGRGVAPVPSPTPRAIESLRTPRARPASRLAQPQPSGVSESTDPEAGPSVGDVGAALVVSAVWGVEFAATVGGVGAVCGTRQPHRQRSCPIRRDESNAVVNQPIDARAKRQLLESTVLRAVARPGDAVVNVCSASGRYCSIRASGRSSL